MRNLFALALFVSTTALAHGQTTTPSYDSQVYEPPFGDGQADSFPAGTYVTPIFNPTDQDWTATSWRLYADQGNVTATIQDDTQVTIGQLVTGSPTYAAGTLGGSPILRAGHSALLVVKTDGAARSVQPVITFSHLHTIGTSASMVPSGGPVAVSGYGQYTSQYNNGQSISVTTPSGATLLVAANWYGDASNTPNVTDNSVPMTQVGSTKTGVSGQVTALFYSAGESAGTHVVSSVYPNGQPSFPIITSFVVTGTSSTTPIDGGVQFGAGYIDNTRMVKCPQVTPNKANEFVTSFFVYGGGDDGLQGLNVTVPSGYNSHFAFGYATSDGVNVFEPTYGNVTVGKEYVCASLLLR